jgi:hypothetical protein
MPSALVPALSPDDVQHAYSAAAAGDLDPVVGLITP